MGAIYVGAVVKQKKPIKSGNATKSCSRNNPNYKPIDLRTPRSGWWGGASGRGGKCGMFVFVVRRCGCRSGGERRLNGSTRPFLNGGGLPVFRRGGGRVCFMWRSRFSNRLRICRLFGYCKSPTERGRYFRRTFRGK